MPDKPTYARRDHPGKAPGHGPLISKKRHGRGSPGYAELCCKSNFSFLRGASHPEELAERAAELGYTALAITDRHTLAGVVRMHCAAKACGLRLIVGAEMAPVDAPPVMLYATDRAAYGRLCRIITQGRLRSPKGVCEVYLSDIAEWCEGLVAVVGGRGRRDPPEADRLRDEGTKGRRGAEENPPRSPLLQGGKEEAWTKGRRDPDCVGTGYATEGRKSSHVGGEGIRAEGNLWGLPSDFSQVTACPRGSRL